MRIDPEGLKTATRGSSKDLPLRGWLHLLVLVVFAGALVLVGVPTFVDSGAERFCPATSEDDANTLLSTIADLVFND